MRVCVRVGVYISVHGHVDACICGGVSVRARMCVSVLLCMRVCGYACACVCLCEYVYVRVCVCGFAYLYVLMCVYVVGMRYCMCVCYLYADMLRFVCIHV